MFITESQIKVIATLYVLAFIASILIIVYTRRLSIKDKILRLIVTVLIPVLGILIVTIEALLNFISRMMKKRNEQLM
jgi:fructose-specific phosphotransferase system IIC component